jgi:putative beta-lysine N-acetyltransferase
MSRKSSCNENIENIENIENLNIRFNNDVYSDRIRCDHPQVDDAYLLGDVLISNAEKLGRGKVVAFVDSNLERGLEKQGFRVAAHMPAFYEGRKDCSVMSFNLDPTRRVLANPKEVFRVEQKLDTVESMLVSGTLKAESSTVLELKHQDESLLCQTAALMGETFKDYPTPSDDPEYLKKYIQDGSSFHVIQSENRVVACASADVIRVAKTAELTDCATNPNYRGRGLMKNILLSLMDSLKTRGFPTAFTLSRARVPGINILFKQLGFEYCGQLSRSCRIGDGLEDINVWSRRL